MHTSHAPRQISPARIFLPPRTSIRAPTNSEPWAPANVLDIADQSHRVECLLWVCAVTRRRFPVGASPRGRRSHRCWPTSTCAGLCWGGRSSVGVETEPGSNQRGTARRKGRQQICSAYSHCATPRLYRMRRLRGGPVNVGYGTRTHACSAPDPSGHLGGSRILGWRALPFVGTRSRQQSARSGSGHYS